MDTTVGPLYVPSAASPVMSRFPMTPMQLAFHHLSKLANPNSGELITFEKHLDVSKLREAIHLALARHPLLNCTPVKRLGRWYWQPAKKSLPVDLRIRNTKLTDQSKLYAHLWSNLWSAQLPADGRQVRFIYTRGPQKSYLQICAPHSVTDACSGTRLAADIGNAYRCLQHGEPYTPEGTNALGARGIAPFTSHMTGAERRTLIRQTATQIATDLVTQGSGLELSALKANKATAVHITEVSDRLLKTTLQTARACGSTAHAFFLLALTQARQEFLGASSDQRMLRINDFATLRPFSDVDLTDTFDVLVVPHQVCIDPAWDTRSALHILTEMLREKKEGGVLSELYRLSLYGTLARVLPTKITAELVFKMVNKSDLAVTNPGKVPWENELESYGDVRILDFINFPHLLPPAKVVLIFSTFRGKLRIIQLYNPETFPNGVEEALVTPLLRRLQGLTQLFSLNREQSAPAANNDRPAVDIRHAANNDKPVNQATIRIPTHGHAAAGPQKYKTPKRGIGTRMSQTFE